MPVYLISYLSSFLFARIAQYALSGFVLIFAALVLFLSDMRRGGTPLHLRALYSLGFVGGQGISCLKLSKLQTSWEWQTWAALFLAYTVFWLAFELCRLNAGHAAIRQRGRRSRSLNSGRLFLAIVGITLISWIAFLLEVRLLGYAPLLVRGVPHAYSYFHVSGVHYFTVSCVLVPSLAVLWFETERELSQRRTLGVLLCVVCSFLIPLLCVSRFQLILAAVTAAFTLLTLERGQIPLWIALPAGLTLLLLYVLLTLARSHSVSYLNDIFEMKRSLPIFLSQPYIYIANNYDNLNCLIRDLPAHTLGLRVLFPLWALTGLKFVFPSLASFPLYVTKTELTTVTLFYDAWYDFGMLGIVVFAALLGILSFYLEERLLQEHHPLFSVLYAQFALYMALSFFTTWFSNPATWFYFIETAAVYLFVRGRRR